MSLRQSCCLTLMVSLSIWNGREWALGGVLLGDDEQGVVVTDAPIHWISPRDSVRRRLPLPLLTLGIYRRRSPQDLARLLPVQQIGDQRCHPAFVDIGVTVDDRCGVDIPDVQVGSGSINLRRLDHLA